MSIYNEKEQKHQKMYCALLKKEIDVIIINSIPYANWKTSTSWLPEEWISGIVEFKAGDPDKHNQTGYGKIIDIETGIQFKILNPTLDKEGHPTFKSLVFNGAKTYDLANIQKRAEAFILAYQEFVNSKYGITTYKYVQMKSIESSAEDNRKRRRKAIEVMKIIDSLEDQELRDFARLLVPVLDNETDTVIKDRLEELAEKKNDKVDGAETILIEFKRTDRSAREIFKRASNYNVIEFKQDVGFTFSGNRLGYAEVEVIRHLKENPMIASSIHGKTSSIIDQMMKSKIQETREYEVLAASANVPKGDKSVTDDLREHGAKKSLENQGYDPSSIMKAMEDISHKMLLKVDEKLDPISKKMNEIMKEKESLDIVYSKDEKEEEEKKEYNDSIESEINDLDNSILLGKTLDEWDYMDLKKHCKENYQLDDYKHKITSKKDEIFEWIIEHRKKLINEGKHANV